MVTVGVGQLRDEKNFATAQRWPINPLLTFILTCEDGVLFISLKLNNIKS